MAQYDEQRILDIQVKYDDAVKGITNFRDEIEKLKAANKDLAEQYKQSGDRQYREQIEANTVVIKQYGENVRILQKEIQNNIRQQQEQEGSLKSLRAELSNLTRKYDELSRTERNSAKGKELQKHINDITKELKGAEEETQRFYRNVGNYKNSIAEALTGNSKFASSLLSIANESQGVEGFFAGIIGRVKSFGAALMGLMSNPVFLGIAGIAGAGAAFKWWYDYNEGLVKASKLTSAFTGTHGDEMKAYRNEIQAVADTFGLDFQETLKTANALVQNYGISWSEAIDKVKDGLLTGGSLLGNYTQEVQNYAGAFKDIGINANQFIGVLSKIGKAGINVDTALQSINRGGFNLQKMSATLSADLKAAGINADDLSKRIQTGQTSTIQAMQEVTKKLAEQGVTSSNTAKVMQDLFGKGAINLGSQFLKVLNNIGTGVDEIKTKASETVKIKDATIKKQAELNNTISAMFDMTGGGFEKMKAQMKYIAVNSLLQLAKAVVKVINYFIDWYNESMVVRYIIQAIVTDFKMAWNTIKLVFNLIIDAVKSVGRQLKGMADIIEGIVTLSWDKIKAGFSTLGSNFGKTFKEGLGDVKAFGMATANDFMDGFNNVVNNKKVKHIEVPVTASYDTGGGGNATTGTTTGGKGSGGTTTKSGKKNATTSKNGVNNSAANAAKVEQEEIRKAQDLLLKLVTDTYEQQREAIVLSYDRQIEDIKKKLDTEKNLTVNARTAMASQVKSLEELKARDLEKIDNEHMEKQINSENERIKNILTTVRKGSEQEYTIKYQQIENEQKLAEIAATKEYTDETERGEQITAIRAAYQQKIKQLTDDYYNAQTEALKQHFETQILAAHDNELEQLRLKFEEKKALYDEAQQNELESDEEYTNRKLQLYNDMVDAQKALSDAELQNEKQKYEAYGEILGSMSSLAEAFGENSKSLAKASKILALGQIAVNMGVALTYGWKTASQVQPYPAMIAAQIKVVADVIAQLAQATKIIKSAKFATGGVITGSGTGTSDDVTIQASNGESVMTAAATSMFSPALSAFNQLGGGVPIITNSREQAVGQEFLAAAVARGMAAAPRPVVSVEEIESKRSRVEVLEHISEQ